MLETIAAKEIAKIALDELAKAGAGELAKKTVSGAVELAKALRDKIRAKFTGNAEAEAALAQAEHERTPAAIADVGKYLRLEMENDPEFDTEVRHMAQQIISQTAGRDIYNIGKIEGNSNRFGGG
ncbi:MAG: hypothetical protein KME35_15600 [Aphanocapsa sp. GSE-SYN-MK-11-07L]|jgi:hypothetical protein|nr:hypothetical protein [Aphanocapsa sp. GSE-SYN-MK-11-07L]